VLSGLPTPHFGPLPAKLRTPKFGPLPVKTADPFAEPEKPIDPCTRRDARGRLIRLPGPTNWWHCPWCGSSTDIMLLGQHLKAVHGKTNTEIDAVGWRDLLTWHSNLHNLTWKPKADVANGVVPACPTCEGWACQVGPVRRLFGRWR